MDLMGFKEISRDLRGFIKIYEDIRTLSGFKRIPVNFMECKAI